MQVVASLDTAVGVAAWRGWAYLKGPLQSQLSQRLQREVRFGDRFSLKLLRSLRLSTDALHVGPPQGPQADPALGGDLVDANDAWVQLPYATVFRLMKPDSDEPPRIASLRFGRVEAALKRLADGRANWSLGPPKQSDPSRPSPELPVVDELVVSNGHFMLHDEV